MITLHDIKAAAQRIEPHIVRTPLVPSSRLSDLTGARVLVKYENMQASGAFKERGAVSRLTLLTDEEKRRGVVAMSAGNHAQGVALHAGRMGIPATIVMPLTTPLVKAQNTRARGATVILYGDTLVEAEQKALEIAATGPVLVHPFDDAAVIAGQGSITLEMLQDQPDLEALVVPMGGGGLISGMAIAAKTLKPRIRIIGVEALLYPTFHNAITGEGLPMGGPTLAEGIAVREPGTLTLPIIRDLVDEIVLVDETMIERAVNAFATLQRTLAEGAGAAGLAAMLARPDLFAGKKTGLVLCGGNIDARLLAAIMMRELERDDCIASFRLTLTDRPGVLAQVAGCLGTLGANILEVSHGRHFLDVPAKGVTIDVTVETRDSEHTQSVEAELRRQGFAPRRLESNGSGSTG
jgi:threonine dehydratase